MDSSGHCRRSTTPHVVLKQQPYIMTVNFVFLGVVGAQSTMMYFLDTTTLRWTRLIIQSGDRPGSRRAHSALYYKGKVWIFGSNVLSAFNDVWTLDVSGRAGFDGAKPMQWAKLRVYWLYGEICRRLFSRCIFWRRDVELGRWAQRNALDGLPCNSWSQRSVHWQSYWTLFHSKTIKTIDNSYLIFFMPSKHLDLNRET